MKSERPWAAWTDWAPWSDGLCRSRRWAWRSLSHPTTGEPSRCSNQPIYSAMTCFRKNKSLTYVTTSSVVNVHQKSDRLIYQLGLLTNNRLLFDLDQVWDIQGFGSAFFLRIRIRAKIFMRIRIRILGRGLGVKGKNEFYFEFFSRFRWFLTTDA